MPKLKYSRILLKLSGEALGDPKDGRGLHPAMFEMLSQEIRAIQKTGCKIGVVMGAGNIFRGIYSAQFHIPELAGHLIGMEAGSINAMILKEVLGQHGVRAVALSALGKTTAMEQYTIAGARRYFEDGYVVLCVGGSGNPFFTHDTAAVLRGLELGCEVVVKATKVDGVYTDDPMKNKLAKKYDTLSFQTALEKNLKVMDQTAFLLAKENKMPILVLNLFKKGLIAKAVKGEKVGTLVS